MTNPRDNENEEIVEDGIDDCLSVEDASRFSEIKEIESSLEKKLISAFVIFFFISANLISLSHYPQFKKALLKKLEPLAAVSGLGQNWAMFSPEPRKMNFHSSLLIQFKDGSLRLMEFPRFELMALDEKFRRHKLRKLFNDVMVNEVGEKYRPAIARFLVSKFNSSENPVKKLSLDFNYQEVRSPDQFFTDRSRPESHLNKSTIFVYFVTPKELSKILGGSR